MIKLTLLLISAIITMMAPIMSKQNTVEDKDVPGRITKNKDGNYSCRPSESKRECIASDCNAPDISTECDLYSDDLNTTANEIF